MSVTQFHCDDLPAITARELRNIVAEVIAKTYGGTGPIYAGIMGEIDRRAAIWASERARSPVVRIPVAGEPTSHLRA